MLNMILIGSFIFYLVIGLVAALRLTHVLEVFENRLQGKDKKVVQQTGCLYKWRRNYMDVAGKMRYIRRGRSIYQLGMHFHR